MKKKFLTKKFMAILTAAALAVGSLSMAPLGEAGLEVVHAEEPTTPTEVISNVWLAKVDATMDNGNPRYSHNQPLVSNLSYNKAANEITFDAERNKMVAYTVGDPNRTMKTCCAIVLEFNDFKTIKYSSDGEDNNLSELAAGDYDEPGKLYPDLSAAGVSEEDKQAFAGLDKNKKHMVLYLNAADDTRKIQFVGTPNAEETQSGDDTASKSVKQTLTIKINDTSTGLLDYVGKGKVIEKDSENSDIEAEYAPNQKNVDTILFSDPEKKDNIVVRANAEGMTSYASTANNNKEWKYYCMVLGIDDAKTEGTAEEGASVVLTTNDDTNAGSVDKANATYATQMRLTTPTAPDQLMNDAELAGGERFSLDEPQAGQKRVTLWRDAAKTGTSVADNTFTVIKEITQTVQGQEPVVVWRAKQTITMDVQQTVTGLSLDKTELSLKTGETASLTATVTPADAFNKAVTFASDKPEIVEVTSEGNITAKSAGTAVITATTADTTNGEPKTAACTVTVTNPPADPGTTQQPDTTVAVTGVTLDKTTLSMDKGTTATLNATVAPANATNKTVTWTTSDPAVATVSNGTVTAVEKGTATITAKAGDKTATCTVTVNVPDTQDTKVTTVSATKVTLNTKQIYMVKGKSVTVKATVAPSNTTDKLSWSTSNKKVATVKNGKISAKAKGNATITAKAGSKKATVKVNVATKATKSTKVTLNKKKATVKAKKTLTLKATLKPAKSTDTLKWSSSNKKVAKVDKYGVVTGVKKGTATITVKTSSGKKATCKITVK